LIDVNSDNLINAPAAVKTTSFRNNMSILSKQERNKVYYQHNREKILARCRQYEGRNREFIAQRKYDFFQRLKHSVLSHYGVDGKAICCNCPETRLNALTIDHINGGGNQHRKEIKKTGPSFYRYLKINGFPPGFRTLCMNCNYKSYRISQQASFSTLAHNVRHRLLRDRLKRRFFEKLGMKCARCGIDDLEILTVGHINSGGNQHRKRLKTHCSTSFYRAILKTDDFNGLEAQCYSCNFVDIHA
jgi:hypothetical protein